jgi:hypothetical protein
MASLDEIIVRLGSLSEESLAEVSRFVSYIEWRQTPEPQAGTNRPWSFDFVEHFRAAQISADGDQAGMDVQVGETTCQEEQQMALWQHPPVEGASFVEFQVPVPAGTTNLRLEFATGIRDGAQLAGGHVVAFRIFVNDWRIWSDTQSALAWRNHRVAMPSLPGDVVSIKWVTDGLGNHEWAWAAWGEPRLVGELPA